MVNDLKELRALELMCKSLISVIGLHRSGVERYESVLIRVLHLKQHMETLLEKERKK